MRKNIAFEKNRILMFDFLEDYFKENDEDSLTITILCNSLKIQRHTFYYHYKNLSDLYEDYLEYNKIKFNSLVKSQVDFPELSRIQIITYNLKLLYTYRYTMNVIYKLSKNYLSADRDYLAEKLFLNFSNYENKDEMTKSVALKGVEETIKLWSLQYNYDDFEKVIHIIYSIGLFYQNEKILLRNF